MERYFDELEHDNFRSNGTGSHAEFPEYKIIEYPFDRYQIKIMVTPDNKFIKIVEVKVNKDFLTYKQKITHFGVHDVEKFYEE
jgi:hypothetical protein